MGDKKQKSKPSVSKAESFSQGEKSSKEAPSKAADAPSKAETSLKAAKQKQKQSKHVALKEKALQNDKKKPLHPALLLVMFCSLACFLMYAYLSIHGRVVRDEFGNVLDVDKLELLRDVPAPNVMICPDPKVSQGCMDVIVNSSLLCTIARKDSNGTAFGCALQPYPGPYYPDNKVLPMSDRCYNVSNVGENPQVLDEKDAFVVGFNVRAECDGKAYDGSTLNNRAYVGVFVGEGNAPEDMRWDTVELLHMAAILYEPVSPIPKTGTRVGIKKNQGKFVTSGYAKGMTTVMFSPANLHMGFDITYYELLEKAALGAASILLAIVVYLVSVGLKSPAKPKKE